MSIATINPSTGEKLKTFEALSDAQLEEKLQLAVSAFAEFRKSTFADRAARMVKAAHSRYSFTADSLVRKLTAEAVSESFSFFEAGPACLEPAAGC
jgi:succinate-semialdehyde dehydrogenase / glutarate-semialdehyde dehydrogenase